MRKKKYHPCHKDKIHCKNGPAIITAIGNKYWYINGQLHREDGPAVEYIKGDKYWLQNGTYHREDGPAIEDADGYKEWYLNGEEYTREVYFNKLEKLRGKEWTNKIRLIYA